MFRSRLDKNWFSIVFVSVVSNYLIADTSFLVSKFINYNNSLLISGELFSNSANYLTANLPGTSADIPGLHTAHSQVYALFLIKLR